MFLTIPDVLGVDESPDKNLLRQIAVRGGTLDGTLSTFTRVRSVVGCFSRLPSATVF